MATRLRSSPNYLNDLLEQKRVEILQIAAQHGARNMRVFGSVARGEAGEESDIDFLIELEQGRTLFDRIALIQDLEDLLGCKVDVVTEKSLHPLIHDEVLEQAVAL